MDRRLPISPIPNNHRKNLDSLKKPYDVENYQGTKASSPCLLNTGPSVAFLQYLPLSCLYHYHCYNSRFYNCFRL